MARRRRISRRVITGVIALVIALGYAGWSHVEPLISQVDGSSSTASTTSSSSFTRLTGASTDASLLSSWSASTAPNYYKVTGKASIPSSQPAAGSIDYEGIDSMGRTGWVHGTITASMIEKSAGWRASFDSDVKDLAGWTNPETGKSNNGEATIVLTTTGKSYHGWFYNRSHLIADSLGGASSRKNLVTGTRMQNVGDNSSTPGGMAFTETQVRNLIKEKPATTVEYDVTPVYRGNEIIPRGVTVDVKSSDGSLDEHVVVWNYANGYAINYTTGVWSKD